MHKLCEFITLHMKIKKPEVHFIIKIFSIKNIFYDKMDYRFFIFFVTVNETLSFLTIGGSVSIHHTVLMKLHSFKGSETIT